MVAVKIERSLIRLQYHILDDVFLPVYQLLQVNVPPVHLLGRNVELLQKKLIRLLGCGRQELAGVVGVVGSEQVEKG